jgi:hypothetical protein
LKKSLLQLSLLNPELDSQAQVVWFHWSIKSLAGETMVPISRPYTGSAGQPPASDYSQNAGAVSARAPAVVAAQPAKAGSSASPAKPASKTDYPTLNPLTPAQRAVEKRAGQQPASSASPDGGSILDSATDALSSDASSLKKANSPDPNDLKKLDKSLADVASKSKLNNLSQSDLANLSEWGYTASSLAGVLNNPELSQKIQQFAASAQFLDSLTKLDTSALSADKTKSLENSAIAALQAVAAFAPGFQPVVSGVTTLKPSMGQSAGWRGV